MFRFTLIPFILLFSTIVFGLVSFFVIRAIKRFFGEGLKKGSDLINKGADLVNKQQKTWAEEKVENEEKEQRKKYPDILQKGLDQYEQLLSNQEQLPIEWKEAIAPLLLQAKVILDEVVINTTLTESTEAARDDEKVLNSVRPFFNHTLDALLQFSENIKNNYLQMTAEQTEKARQNITIFKFDLTSHQETLLRSKKIDFDVQMDVIKARLKK